MILKPEQATCGFEREPLLKPFGFKGGYMNEIWQVATIFKSGREDLYGWGVGVQNVLWSDPEVFAGTTPGGGNAIMFAITDRALQLVRQTGFDTPVGLLEDIFDDVYEYAVKITGNPDLKKTFVLNALVSVDNAAWLFYARSHGIRHFDDLIPEEYRNAFTHKHTKVASIPIASYGMSVERVRQLIEKDGYFILKFKFGAPGTQQEMLEKDKQRVEDIHRAVENISTPYTKDGKLPYYFDMNGRYQSKETLQLLLDHCRLIGALDQIRILEEPFPEHIEVDVNDLGVTVAADESAHTAENVAERISMGYGAIALKPVAKTLSATFKMAKAAQDRDIPCFCADLTVNPLLVDWNKNVAARLAPLPGLNFGLLETNGHQNYKRWSQMKHYHPCSNAGWIQSEKGFFNLDNDFYEQSGGIFKDSPHYLAMAQNEEV